MKITKKESIILIILFGLVSLFGDFIYESARSISGQYLLLLGATSAIVGFFVGLSEFLGNFLRFFVGLISDKTRNYWFFIILGYSLLIFVPLMAFTNTWQVAVLFIIFERIGKAIRNPARDTLVSIISEKSKNVGFSFGIIELLDQLGALVGPIIIALVFLFSNLDEVGKYRLAYFILFVPFAFLMFSLLSTYTYSRKIKVRIKKLDKKEKISKLFWFYITFTFFSVLGFVNFAILGYHFKLNGIFSDHFIIILYSLAMIADAFIAPFIGKFYDEMKKRNRNFFDLLVALPILNIFIAVFVFSDVTALIIFAMLLYGIVLGMQETVMRAAVADITPLHKRGISYGLFSFFFGISIFVGSSIIGFLYKFSITYVIYFVFVSQIISALVLILIRKKF